jgi:hypothetical protein
MAEPEAQDINGVMVTSMQVVAAARPTVQMALVFKVLVAQALVVMAQLLVSTLKTPHLIQAVVEEVQVVTILICPGILKEAMVAVEL